MSVGATVSPRVAEGHGGAPRRRRRARSARGTAVRGEPSDRSAAGPRGPIATTASTTTRGEDEAPNPGDPSPALIEGESLGVTEDELPFADDAWPPAPRG